MTSPGMKPGNTVHPEATESGGGFEIAQKRKKGLLLHEILTDSLLADDERKRTPAKEISRPLSYLGNAAV